MATLKEINQPATGGVAAVATAPNPVLAFLNQRPLPLPINPPVPKQKVSSSEDMRRLHTAGGYEYSCYEKRNWAQIEGEYLD